jgi:hypothetical protein
MVPDWCSRRAGATTGSKLSTTSDIGGRSAAGDVSAGCIDLSGGAIRPIDDVVVPSTGG